MDLKEQYDKLLKYCYMKTKNIHQAEDITQETFLRFWQDHNYKDTGKQMAYLYTIARNLCMDEFRRKETLDIDDFPELQAPQEPIIEKIEIDEALDTLPEDIREIVILRYLNDISVADIGKVLGISRFSVNRRLKKGLSLMRKRLEGDDRNDRQRIEKND